MINWANVIYVFIALPWQPDTHTVNRPRLHEPKEKEICQKSCSLTIHIRTEKRKKKSLYKRSKTKTGTVKLGKIKHEVAKNSSFRNTELSCFLCHWFHTYPRRKLYYLFFYDVGITQSKERQSPEYPVLESATCSYRT